MYLTRTAGIETGCPKSATGPGGMYLTRTAGIETPKSVYIGKTP